MQELVLRAAIAGFAVLLAGCGGLTSLATCPTRGAGCAPNDAGPGLACGPGTEQVGNKCVVRARDGGTRRDANDSGNLKCGQGTVQSGSQCVPAPQDATTPDSDGGALDSGIDSAADASDAGEAGVADTQEAPCFAIDPAHDNAEPDESIQSPLTSSWTAALSGEPGYAVVTQGKVIVGVGGSQPSVLALEVRTGKPMWGPIPFASTPLIAYGAGTVFALTESGQLTAWDAVTGAILWATNLTGQSEFPAPPVASGGYVYVNGFGQDGSTYAVDAKTGNLLWRASSYYGSSGADAVYGGTVYEADGCDHLWAFDAMTGALLWQ